MDDIINTIDNKAMELEAICDLNIIKKHHQEACCRLNTVVGEMYEIVELLKYERDQANGG